MATLTLIQDDFPDPTFVWAHRLPAGVAVGQAIPLDASGVTIGRTQGQGRVCLPYPPVSRSHARVFAEGGVFHVEDVSSRHGVRLNGLPVAGRSPLADGDRIQILCYVFVFGA